MNKQLNAKEKLKIYLKGWTHGAGRKAIQFKDQSDYMRGYMDGHASYFKAEARAQKHYKVTLDIVRAL